MENDNEDIARKNITNNMLKEEFSDTMQKKVDDDINAVVSLKVEDSNKVFVDVYNKTGDGILAAKIAYNLDSDEGARMKSALMLREDRVIQAIEKDMVKNFTLEKLQGESWLLYKKCMKEGNKIKALELLAKLRGYLSDKFVLSQNFNSWNVLIQQANLQQTKENDERANAESIRPSEDISTKPL